MSCSVRDCAQPRQKQSHRKFHSGKHFYRALNSSYCGDGNERAASRCCLPTTFTGLAWICESWSYSSRKTSLLRSFGHTIKEKRNRVKLFCANTSRRGWKSWCCWRPAQTKSRISTRFRFSKWCETRTKRPSRGKTSRPRSLDRAYSRWNPCAFCLNPCRVRALRSEMYSASMSCRRSTRTRSGLFDHLHASYGADPEEGESGRREEKIENNFWASSDGGSGSKRADGVPGGEILREKSTRFVCYPERNFHASVRQMTDRSAVAKLRLPFAGIQKCSNDSNMRF